MNRLQILESLAKRKQFDFLIIGGGASGIGCAVDAATRDFSVLLLEQSDFGKGTSSRSTKLVHGGVRYLAQGDISLVREALKERGVLKKNAPHLVYSQGFIVPCYSFWQKFYYGAGLKIYNLLSGKYGFGKSRVLSKKETLEKLPNIKSKNLSGGVMYYDGQFDDSRLLIELAKTAAENSALLLNYAKVSQITKNHKGKIDGINFEDLETGERFYAKAKAIINATGAWTDEVRKMADSASEKIMSLSQGIHLVFEGSFLPGEDAVMIPKTSDGRVLFMIPWLGKTLVGTTDTPIKNAELEPKALEKEIEFILETCKKYLSKAPTREDILSVFAGIRPLVKSAGAVNTASLSRDHTIEISPSGLLTLTGGKWTTYRNMAEDAINTAIEVLKLPSQKCVTKNLKIKNERTKKLEELIRENKNLAELIHADFPYQKAEIVYGAREEFARTVEDILARRTRLLFLNARAAIEVSRDAAEIMAEELGKDKKWVDKQLENFESIAKNYLM